MDDIPDVPKTPAPSPSRKRWTRIFSNRVTKSWIEASRRFGILLAYQIVGWIIFTKIEDGFWISECMTNSREIKSKLEGETNQHPKLLELYSKMNTTFEGNITPYQFNETFQHFLRFFHIKDFVVSKEITKEDMFGYCTRWIQFSAVSVTTIGYGNLVPKTDAGKLFVILYTFFGIPVAVYFFTYMGRVLTLITTLILGWCESREENARKRSREAKTFVALCLLFVIFIGFNVVMETIVTERLSVVDALYFSWVTTTTIGYGDIPPESSSSFLSMLPYIELAIVSSIVDSFLTMVIKTQGISKAVKHIFCPGNRSNVNLERLRLRELRINSNSVPLNSVSTA